MWFGRWLQTRAITVTSCLRTSERWEFAVIFARPPAAEEIGKRTRPLVRRSTQIDAGLEESEGDGCSVDAVNIWNVLSRMRMKREGSAGSICAAASISLNVC
jgi:hypothetical protein